MKKKISKDELATEQKSASLERDNIRKLFPNLKIVDATDEMIGKTSLFTWIKPVKNQIRIMVK